MENKTGTNLKLDEESIMDTISNVIIDMILSKDKMKINHESAVNIQDVIVYEGTTYESILLDSECVLAYKCKQLEM